MGSSHPETARSLDNLAELYYRQGRYGEAEELYKQTLSIYEEELGATHPETATSLNNLATLYYQQGRYGDAKLLYKRAVEVSLAS